MLVLAELLDEDAAAKLDRYVDEVLMRVPTPPEDLRGELVLLFISALHDGVPRPVLEQLVPRLDDPEPPTPHAALRQSIEAAAEAAAAEAARRFTSFLAA